MSRSIRRLRLAPPALLIAVTLAPNVDQINNLQIAPGHAVLTFNSVVTGEPVS